jgi:23S rRNA (uridine2552-2'-O)-methyltransferase
VTNRDEYYNRAKQAGYRTRSAYKLRQLDEQAGLLGPGDRVVDLGAAPGGWLQVAAERVGAEGRVLGVDRQRIRPLEPDDPGGGDGAAPIETLRGDLTDSETRDEIRDRLGDGADAVLSDVAPDMTGQYDLDHARSVHLARQALAVAERSLRPGGDLAVKVFDGRDLDDLRAEVETAFEYVRTCRPAASRDASSELYLVGKGRVDAPVAAGETRSLSVVDEGSEGDGVAKVDGYTVFVPGATAGETVEARITEVKPTYAFAERVD